MTLEAAKKSDIVITTALIPGRKAVFLFIFYFFNFYYYYIKNNLAYFDYKRMH